MKNMRSWIAVMLVLCVLAALTGCGSNASKSEMMVEGYYSAEKGEVYRNDGAWDVDYYEEAPMEYNGMDPAPQSIPDESRKWIITADVTVETEDLTQFLAQLDAQVAAFGGYSEARNVYGNSASDYRSSSAYLSVRIPAERVDEFLGQVGGFANVTDSRKTVEDVTLNYVDSESRVKALRTEQQRLMELLEKAESLTDILAIEDRLTMVRYELESAESCFRALSGSINYATVTVSVREVRVFTPTAERTMWEEIRDGFKENLSGLIDWLRDLLVWFLADLPTLTLLAAAACGIIIPLRVLHKRRKAKKAQKASDEAAPE